MESERVSQKNKSTWKSLLVGILLGIFISFLALVSIAFKWGPQGQSITIELYSGKTTLRKHFLWRHWQEPKPTEPHVQWAIDHQGLVKTWYLGGSSIARSEWFGDMMAMDVVVHMPTNCVYEIYSLKIPKKEKVELLHQYHQGLGLVRQKEQELRQQKYPQLEKDMIAFKAKWNQELQKLKNDATEAIPTP